MNGNQAVRLLPQLFDKACYYLSTLLAEIQYSGPYFLRQPVPNMELEFYSALLSSHHGKAEHCSMILTMIYMGGEGLPHQFA